MKPLFGLSVRFQWASSGATDNAVCTGRGRGHPHAFLILMSDQGLALSLSRLVNISTRFVAVRVSPKTRFQSFSLLEKIKVNFKGTIVEISIGLFIKNNCISFQQQLYKLNMKHLLSKDWLF